MSRARLTAAAAGIALLLTGCARGDTTSPATADATSDGSDGRVVLYSGRNEQLVQPILDRFTDDTGVAVEVRYGQTAGMAAQLIEEGERSPAEVFLAQDAGALGAVAKEGLFVEVPRQVLERVPDAYRDAEGRWVGVTGRVRVLAYDSEALTPQELPTSVSELTDETWRGKVGIAPTNASFQSFVTAMRVVDGDASTEAFLRGLKDNDVQIRERNGQIVADVDAGRLPTGLVNHYYLGELAAEKGVSPQDLRVRLHFFADGDLGGLVNVAGAGLVGDQPDGDAAALLDYLLSDATQRAFVAETYEYPLVAGVEGPADLPALSDLQQPQIDLNDLDTLGETVEMVKRVGLG